MYLFEIPILVAQ